MMSAAIALDMGVKSHLLLGSSTVHVGYECS